MSCKTSIVDESAFDSIKSSGWHLVRERRPDILMPSPPAPVIASKIVNALIESVEVSALGSTAAKALGAGKYVSPVLWGFRKYYGGLWVGGTARLTETDLSFEPNALNRLLQKGELSVVVPLNKITKVILEGGFFTKIIAVETREFTLRVRCYGAAEFVDKIRQACARYQM